MIMLGEAFLCSWVCLIFLFSNSFSVILFNEDTIFYRTCTHDATFKQILNIPQTMCAEECIRRQRCEVMMYRHDNKFCALKDFMNITELDETGNLCLFFVPDELYGGYTGPCFNHTCADNERCSDVSEAEYGCVKSECPAPKELGNAYVLSNTHEIGTTNRYTCNSGYVERGTPTITCKDDATWTVTDFNCARKCRISMSGHYNADIIAMEGDGTAGTILHFKCRDGYTRIGTTADSTCGEDANWFPRQIHCCNDNSSDISYSDCYKLVGGGKTYSYDESFSYCQSLGGYMRWVDWDMALELVQFPGVKFILQYHKKSYYAAIWNYTACALENDATPNDTLSTDEKIHEAMSEHWNGTYCWLADIGWGEGQPSGGEAEDCMFLNTDLRYHDYYCEYQGQSIVGFVCGFSLPVV